MNYKAIRDYEAEAVKTFPSFVIRDLRRELERTGRHYASDECVAGTCSYPRTWFGKCSALYRDFCLHKELGI